LALAAGAGGDWRSCETATTQTLERHQQGSGALRIGVSA
jgi:hypothetical protein